MAFFKVGVERFRYVVDAKLREPNRDHREQLLEIISTHYDCIRTEDVCYFETAAFWGRNPEFRSFRESWYQRLTESYLDLLKTIQAGASDTTLMTLVLGGWITMGNTRSVYRGTAESDLKDKLLRGTTRLFFWRGDGSACTKLHHQRRPHARARFLMTWRLGRSRTVFSLGDLILRCRPCSEYKPLYFPFLLGLSSVFSAGFLSARLSCFSLSQRGLGTRCRHRRGNPLALTIRGSSKKRHLRQALNGERWLGFHRQAPCC